MSTRTKKCKYCKKEINKGSRVCPFCQKKQGTGCLTYVVGAIALFIFVPAFIGSCSNNKANNNNDSENEIIVTENAEDTTTQEEGTESLTVVTETSNTDTETKNEESEAEVVQEDELKVSQLYQDFFAPYINSINKLTVNGFSQSEKLSDYHFEVTEGNENDLWCYKIFDESGDYVLLYFIPDDFSGDEGSWIWTLTSLNYERGNKEISVNDSSHLYTTPKYNTFDKDRDTPNQEVRSKEDLEEFMFSE